MTPPIRLDRLNPDMLMSFGYISSWWIWVALVIVFAVIEVCTFGLVTVWFAIAALIMTFLSFLKIPFSIQILIFLILSAVLLVFTRPLAVKKFKIGREKTNAESLIGKHALVIKRITEFETGQVKINGQVWTARGETGKALENNAEIAEGAKCEILRIEGVRLIVKKLEEVSE